MRLVNLQAILHTGLTAGWPAWMDAKAATGGPGLCPILRGIPAQALESYGRIVSLEVGVTLPAYHFDFAGDPMDPNYEMCSAFPLHGEISPALIAEAWDIARKAGYTTTTD